MYIHYIIVYLRRYGMQLNEHVSNEIVWSLTLTMGCVVGRKNTPPCAMPAPFKSRWKVFNYMSRSYYHTTWLVTGFRGFVETYSYIFLLVWSLRSTKGYFTSIFFYSRVCVDVDLLFRINSSAVDKMYGVICKRWCGFRLRIATFCFFFGSVRWKDTR